MSLPLPDELKYGFAEGRWLLAVADGPDEGRMPDGRPATGTINLNPKVKQTTKHPVDGKPVDIINAPVVCGLDDQGRLTDPAGAVGVWVPVGRYVVTYSIPGATKAAHDIEVLESHTEASPLFLNTAAPPGGPILSPSEYAELAARVAALEGGGDEPGDPLELRVFEDYFQWRRGSSGYWTNLIALSTLQGAKGDPGDQGPAGNLVSSWEGAWNELTEYQMGAVVEHEGSTYMLSQVTSIGSPPFPESEQWELVAARGEKGDKGDKGDEGDKGDQGDPGVVWVVSETEPQDPVEGMIWFDTSEA